MDIKVARRLLRRRSSPAPNISTPDEGVEIDYRQRSHLKRLFFPGKKKKKIMLVKLVNGSLQSLKVLLNPDETETIIATNSTFESYRSCIDVVLRRYQTSPLERTDDEMEIQLCIWFMAVTNTQCEVTQWLSLRDCNFIDNCATLSATGSLSTSTIYAAADNGVRRSLAKLVEVSLVPFSSA